MTAHNKSSTSSAYSNLLRTADIAQQRFATFLKPHKLTPSQYLTLEILCQEEEALTQGALSKRVGCTPGNLTLVVENLSKGKLVSREVSEKDRRFNFLKPTDLGRKTYEGLQPECESMFADFLKPLSDEELSALGALPQKLGIAQ